MRLEQAPLQVLALCHMQKQVPVQSTPTSGIHDKGEAEKTMMCSAERQSAVDEVQAADEQWHTGCPCSTATISLMLRAAKSLSSSYLQSLLAVSTLDSADRNKFAKACNDKHSPGLHL